ncbi:hypothetical protein [Magnetospirillum molischianum]|uniref:Uncharacterized protein n=1 Tax=Magnetospirillum molischianum DSM 120 TaxID=1150626 RepID=H8FYB7_MAGML|nr:hypothetical protein [Magnetospirillum molischianum]CCG43355.1 conserved hypothetical protein [Magnetospirillum molischianum DSM 120]
MMTLPEQIENRMLSGEPFTYGDLCRYFDNGEKHGRLIDQIIQRLRKKGMIAFTRVGRQVIWKRVEKE